MDMLKPLTAFVLLALGAPATAQTCPEFFRFVDFGLIGADAKTYRGGAVFRAEDFDEVPLLVRDQTQCIDVPEVSKDGRGNPIPVVTRIEYDMSSAGLDLQTLAVVAVTDTGTLAEQHADAHRTRLDQPGTRTVRGDSFLCAAGESSGLSCQLVSPYPGTAPLVVYCGTALCRVSVIAMNARLMVSASWERDAAMRDPDTAGPEIADRIGKIHGFLSPISSGL